MKSSTSAVYAFLLLIGDFLAIMGAFALAYVFRVSLSDAPFIAISSAEYARIFLYLSPIWIGIFALLGLYNRDVYEWRLKEFGKLIVGSFVGTMAMITYEFAVARPVFPARIIAVYAFAVACLLLILERTILRSFRLLARHRGIGIINTFLIGDSEYTNILLESLKVPRRSGYRVVGVVSSKDLPSWYKGKVFHGVDDALSAIDKMNVHSIVLTSLYKDPLINEKIMATAQENHVGFRFVPAQDATYSGTMEVELFQEIPLVLVRQTPLFGGGRILKRLFDIVAGSLLLFIASPVIGLMCLLLYIFDHGDPIYRPNRLTRFNDEVGVFKIRTHKHEYNNLSPEQAFTKMGRPELIKPFRDNGDQIANDPRVSRLGGFMRKTSIDELPQLINVIRGDISLVGPRPLSAFELKDYPYRHIMLSVKTGVTGLAVISGRKDIPFEERRKLDLYYVQNWSFWLDIKILFRTALEVLKIRGS